MATVTVHISYKGYLAVRAGCAEERVGLPLGSGFAEVLDHVASRCALSPEQRRCLFVSIDNSASGEEALGDGDRVTVAILVGGG
ncbi:MAG: hypothetical protein RDU89_02560 [bacterium]|nr:hypothetical protein [bacterium]